MIKMESRYYEQCLSIIALQVYILLIGIILVVER